MLRPALMCAVVLASASAQDPREIIEKTQQHQPKSEHYEGTLQIQDPQNKTATKHWIFNRLENKSLLRFTAPPEIKGVALLIVTHPDHSSDQWLWTPAIERERRIAVQDRSTRFFGTDFSFEDLEPRDINQFDYKLMGDGVVDHAPAWKIESRPKPGKASQYTSSILWVQKDTNVIVRIENYSRDKLMRRIMYSEIQKHDNTWTPHRIEAFDANRNSSTVLMIEKLQYNQPMRLEGFTVEGLRQQP